MSKEEDKQERESQLLVLKWLSEFEPENVSGSVLDENIKYLEKTMERLEGLMVKSISDSRRLPTARGRAIARDTAKSTEGLVNGIKYGISFLIYGNKEILDDNNNGTGPNVQ